MKRLFLVCLLAVIYTGLAAQSGFAINEYQEDPSTGEYSGGHSGGNTPIVAPEPATMALIGSGMLGAALLKKKKLNK